MMYEDNTGHINTFGKRSILLMQRLQLLFKLSNQHRVRRGLALTSCSCVLAITCHGLRAKVCSHRAKYIMVAVKLSNLCAVVR